MVEDKELKKENNIQKSLFARESSGLVREIN